MKVQIIVYLTLTASNSPEPWTSKQSQSSDVIDKSTFVNVWIGRLTFRQGIARQTGSSKNSELRRPRVEAMFLDAWYYNDKKCCDGQRDGWKKTVATISRGSQAGGYFECGSAVDVSGWFRRS